MEGGEGFLSPLRVETNLSQPGVALLPPGPPGSARSSFLSPQNVLSVPGRGCSPSARGSSPCSQPGGPSSRSCSGVRVGGGVVAAQTWAGMGEFIVDSDVTSIGISVPLVQK